MASIGCWMVAQLPQLVRNYRSKSAEALSPWFLAEWLLVGGWGVGGRSGQSGGGGLCGSVTQPAAAWAHAAAAQQACGEGLSCGAAASRGLLPPPPLPTPSPARPPQGDTFNLVGALLKGDQLPTVVFTAQYFICVDAVMLVQYL